MGSYTRPRCTWMWEGPAKAGVRLMCSRALPHPPPSQSTALTLPHTATASVVLSPTGIDRCAAGATNICGPGTCVNLPDGYRCVCSPGYRLHPSQAYCTGVHAGGWGSLGGWGGWGQGWGPVQRPRQPKVQAVLCGWWAEEPQSPWTKLILTLGRLVSERTI